MVLVYHRIARADRDPFGLCVQPDRFDQQLDVLGALARIVPLRALVADLAGGTLAGRVAALTFDDGYLDNLESALPTLGRLGLPATLFVATDYVDRQTRFWWDELTTLIFAGDCPGTIRVRVADETLEWPLVYEDTPVPENWRAWEHPPNERTAVYRELWQILQSVGDETRDSIMAQLRAQIPELRAPTDRPLTRDELCDMARSGLFEIGAHTRSHCRLSALSSDEQEQEIVGSREWLEDTLGEPIRTFSYPFGAPDSYTADTIAIVRGAGFECACAVAPEAVTPGTSAFELPRLQVEDWEPDLFSEKITRLLRH